MSEAFSTISLLVKKVENHQFALQKIAAGDADYIAGRITLMDEVEHRSQFAIERGLATNSK